MKEKSLSQKELLFCTYYSMKRNAAEAAVKAGYCVMPERAALKLLRKPGIQKQIALLSRENRVSSSEVEAGLRRLAFGCVGDAVKIAVSDELSEDELKRLDLFNVSEIKYSKGKGIEIKFFDRIKALEKLTAFADNERKNISDSFIRAIEEGADALRAGCVENS